MLMTRTARRVVPLALALFACSNGSQDGGGLDDATARLAITQAPSDVSCLRLSVTGTRAIARLFDLKPQQSTVFVLSGLPDGKQTFLAEAFAQSCAFVGASSSAGWISDPVDAVLRRGKSVDVHLVMHANAGANVSVDFPDGGTGGGQDGGPVKDPPLAPPPDPFALGESTFPSVQQGDAAAARLSGDRQGLLEQLRRQSKGPVTLIVDDKTGVVLSLDLSLFLPGQSSLERARSFLGDYAALLDPLIDPAELQAATDPHCREAAVVLDRYVEKRPVMGSRLTFQFSNEGALVQIVNGIAPAPSLVSDRPAAPMGGRPLQDLSPRDAPLKRNPVLVPQPDGSGLLRADLVMWPALGQGFEAAIAIGDVAMGTAGTLVVKGNGRAGFSPGAPSFFAQGSESGTAVPTFISYRALQGAPANMLPGERNPIEAGYRFLEDHPALFRSGMARCQFSSGGINESASLPGAVSVRMNQRYLGLPVYGAQVLFHLEGTNHVMAAGGHVLPAIDVAATPSLDAAGAVNTARAAVRGSTTGTAFAAWGSQVAATPSVSELVVYPGSLASGGRKADTRLAWKITMDDVTMLIDAATGELLFSETARMGHNVINDGQGSNEFGRLGFVTEERDGVATGAIAPNTDVLAARAALSGTAAAYAGLGWLGSNGGGSDFVANTNVNVSSGCLNAFFTSIVGEAFFCLGMAGDDVVGHEFTHGVIASSARLVYQDESGALNESLADLMGNLIFPDATGPSNWLVGELEARGTLRDMKTPGNFGHPGHISGYVPRGASCTFFPWSCDSGGVHTNSGITNRGFVLLTDGVPGVTPGIGRAKMARLAFLTTTQHLTPWSRLNDVPMAMRDTCDALVARSGTGIDGSLFGAADCDQIPIAFNQVGLNPTLSTGWSEPDVLFDHVDTFYSAGETTTTGCLVTNVVAQMNTISGVFTADLDPATASPQAVDFGGIYGLDILSTPSPIGTTGLMHRVHWFDFFGRRPSYATQVVLAPPPADHADCRPATGTTPIERVSASTFHPLEVRTLFGANGVDVIGNPSRALPTGCVLRNTQVEITNDNGIGVLTAPGPSVDHDLAVDCFFFVAHFHRRATINSQPPGGTDFSAPVTWSFDAGQQVRFRLRYYLDKPVGVADCQP